MAYIYAMADPAQNLDESVPESAPRPVSEEGDPVLRAMRNAPVGPPLTSEQRAFIEECERESAGDTRTYTTAEILEMIARDARDQGATEAEIQEHVYGICPGSDAAVVG